MINRPQIYGTSKWIKSDSESSRMFFDSFEHMRHNFLSQKYEFSYQATRKATILYNIPAEQCPQDLAYFLIEIHDVLDGDKSKITKENIEYDASNNETQPSAEMYNDSFFDYQQQIHKVDLQKESLVIRLLAK